MRRLRVLYLLPAEGFGGAERQGLYHLRELPRNGVDVTAFVGPSQAALGALRALDVPHDVFPHFPDRTRAPLTALGGIGYFKAWLSNLEHSTAEIRERVRGRRVDVIFANRTFAWLVAASLGRRLGVPYVIRAGSRPAFAGLGLGLSILDHVARPAAVFSNCLAVQRDIAAHFHAPRRLLPNAVDETVFLPGSPADARARLGLPPFVPLIGLAARPAPEKGFDLFQRVVARVHASRPDACFVVAGEFGYRPRYEAALRQAGLAGATRFLGHVERMPDFYRAVDVVVLTSRERSIEGSPNALLEAMATERPIVATAVGGIPELVEAGTSGYLTAEDDARGFSDHVLRLLEDPTLSAAVGRAGRARALSRHRVGAVVRGLARDLKGVALSRDPDLTSPFFAAPAH